MANTSGPVLVPLRSGLIAALADLPEFDGVQATFAPKAGAKNRKQVWTQEGEFDLEPASMRAGTTFSNEVGEFVLIFLVETPAKAPEEAATQASVLMTAAYDFIQTHVNWNTGDLGVDLTSLNTQGRGRVIEAFNDKGAIAEGRLPVHYVARIE